MSKTQTFGAFFRARRLALGLSLREFGRRNGFDPGNISRLERGLVPPPRSPSILEEFAQSLNLPTHSEERRKLFELAVPDGFRATPQIVRKRRTCINAVDIIAWADFVDARRQLPRLVRRLIYATSPDIERIEFPAGEGGEKKGWDGMLRTGGGSKFAPAGLSVWELGTSGTPARKATDDLRARTKDPRGIDPHETTFVFVTPRRWEGKDKWEAAANAKRVWKEVRAYDADSLEAWLELAPGVDTWFAIELGKRTEGTISIDEHWANLASLAEPPLLPDVFLVSRTTRDGKPCTDVLANWLAGPPSVLVVDARSPAEGIDFLAAYVAALDPTEQDRLASRIVVVENRDAWNALRIDGEPLTLVPKPEVELGAEDVSAAVQKGRHVMICSDRLRSERVTRLELLRTNVYELEKALGKSGIKPADAQKKAFDSGGSLTVLKRRISRHAATIEPEWSREPAADELAPLILIGGWEEASTSDQRVVASVTGASYEEVAASVKNWSKETDPPILRLPGRWCLTSREDSWILLENRLRSEHLNRWHDAAVEVFSYDDPMLEVVGKKTNRATFSRRQKNSVVLRNGIAETLALLAYFKDRRAGESEIVQEGAILSKQIVEKVLGGKPGCQRWAYLDQQLPLLAEAAPDEFLTGVEAELDDDSPDLLPLFESESSCLYAGLVAALETLCWSTTYLSRASDLLARLAKLDEGDRWHNRPKDSLREIFLPWLPQNTADIAVQQKVLNRIATEYPNVARKLFLELLSSMRNTSSWTHRPKWATWASEWNPTVTHHDYWAQISFSSQRLLDLAGQNPGHWCDLVERIDDIHPDLQGDAIERLSSIDVAAMPVEERQKVAQAIRDKVAHFRRHSSVRWRLPESAICSLEQAVGHFEPEDPVARNAWLFAGRPKLPGVRGLDLAGAARESELARERQRAITEVFAAGGIEEVIRLAEAAKEGISVGMALAQAQLCDEIALLPTLLGDSRSHIVEIAQGYSAIRFQLLGSDWLAESSRRSWTPLQLANLALALRPNREIWKFVEQQSQETIAIYWSQVWANYYLLIGDPADLEYAVTRFLDFNRSAAAIECIDEALYKNIEVRDELLFQTLEAPESSNDDDRPTSSKHAIQHIFQHLQDRVKGLDAERLARLEERHLHVFDSHSASPATLLKRLGSNSEYFARLLTLTAGPPDEPVESRKERSEEQLQQARNARRLLNLWEALPGHNQETNVVDEEALRAWIIAARKLCTESGRLRECDHKIGELLAHSPLESDGTGPSIAVRDVFEEFHNDAIESSFVSEMINKRGMYCKSSLQGGDAERELAAENARYAQSCQVEWPRIAGALRKVAEVFEDYGRREDAEAEARRLAR